MRRRPGIAGIQQRRDTNTQMRSVGELAERQRVDVIREQLSVFRSSLEEFALKYKNDIRRCATTRGVPLPGPFRKILSPPLPPLPRALRVHMCSASTSVGLRALSPYPRTPTEMSRQGFS